MLLSFVTKDSSITENQHIASYVMQCFCIILQTCDNLKLAKTKGGPGNRAMFARYTGRRVRHNCTLCRFVSGAWMFIMSL